MRAGLTLGQTDDLGFQVTEDPVHVHDLQATILHSLGLNHEQLTFTYSGPSVSFDRCSWPSCAKTSNISGACLIQFDDLIQGTDPYHITHSSL